METGAAVQATGSGTLILNGTGGNGTDGSNGVLLLHANTVVMAAGGALSITGSSQGSVGDNHGIEVDLVPRCRPPAAAT